LYFIGEKRTSGDRDLDTATYTGEIAQALYDYFLKNSVSVEREPQPQVTFKNPDSKKGQ
jgi:hypothetical protein